MTLNNLIEKVYLGNIQLTEAQFLKAIELIEDTNQRSLMEQRASGLPLSKVKLDKEYTIHEIRGIEDRAIKALRHPRITSVIRKG